MSLKVNIYYDHLYTLSFVCFVKIIPHCFNNLERLSQGCYRSIVHFSKLDSSFRLSDIVHLLMLLQPVISSFVLSSFPTFL